MAAALSHADEGWEIARDAPEFCQRLRVTFADGDNTTIAKSKISFDNETWDDDLQIRTTEPARPRGRRGD